MPKDPRFSRPQSQLENALGVFHCRGLRETLWPLDRLPRSCTCQEVAPQHFKKPRIETGVTAFLYRYRSAIIAQAFATLSELFPSRAYLGVGTGEAMNEVPLGPEWPRFTERVQITKEVLEIIRLLWNQSFVNYDGKYSH